MLLSATVILPQRLQRATKIDYIDKPKKLRAEGRHPQCVTCRSIPELTPVLSLTKPLASVPRCRCCECQPSRGLINVPRSRVSFCCSRVFFKMGMLGIKKLQLFLFSAFFFVTPCYEAHKITNGVQQVLCFYTS